MYFGQGRILDRFWGSVCESSTSLVPTSQLTQSVVVLSRYSYCFPTVQPISTGYPLPGTGPPGNGLQTASPTKRNGTGVPSTPVYLLPLAYRGAPAGFNQVCHD